MHCDVIVFWVEMTNKQHEYISKPSDILQSLPFVKRMQMFNTTQVSLEKNVYISRKISFSLSELLESCKREILTLVVTCVLSQTPGRVLTYHYLPF